MNKKAMLVMCTLWCVHICLGETNILERAKVLFAPEVMSNPNLYMDTRSGEYSAFIFDIAELPNVSTSGEIVDTLNYVVSSITSLVVNVSTNEVRQGPELRFLPNRGYILDTIMLYLMDLPANTNVCLDIAHYLGRVKRTPFPEDLARMRRSDTYWYPDPEKMAKKKAEIEAWWRKRDHQYRVYCDNRSVDDYRRELLRACGESLLHCKKIMSPEAFISFTNEMVKASNATSEEQKTLFRRLKHD